jgi:hypothetical protein
MTHCTWHFSQTVYTAKGDGRLKDTARIQKTSRKFDRPSGEANHRTCATALRLMNGQTLGIASSSSRKEHFLRVTTLDEVVNDFLCVFLSSLDSEMHSFDAAQEEEAFEGCQSSAFGILQKRNTVRKVGALHTHKTPCAIGMAREKLRSRMNNDIHT